MNTADYWKPISVKHKTSSVKKKGSDKDRDDTIQQDQQWTNKIHSEKYIKLYKLDLV